ncbi:hypothetical protein [Sphingomonas sp. SAFR-052]|uniref:hypothetical protein n=1 Tax=Sphingomonas sp. SAFR-052 TaxID=3436867 RepID=UPI003F80F5CB
MAAVPETAMVEFLAIGAHAVRRAEVGTALLARIAGTERIVLADTQPQRFDYARGQFGFEERVVADAALADTLAAMALTRMPQLIDDADSVLKAIVIL